MRFSKITLIPNVKSLLPVLAMALFFWALPAQAATYTVDTTATDADGDCGGISGDCSLPDAIAAAAATDTIDFNAGLSGSTLDVSAMPGGNILLAGVILDGRAGGATPGITLDGGVVGLDAGTTLEYVIVSNSDGDGVNVIGGATTVVIDNNVIINSTGDGIQVNTGCQGVTISNNHIGYAVGAVVASPNGGNGVEIFQNVQTVTISANKIGGNTLSGVHLIGDGAAGGSDPRDITFTFNIIGLSADTNTAIPNGSRGIEIQDVDVTGLGTNQIKIGLDTGVYAGNVISGNTAEGISIDNAAADVNGIRLFNNYLGVSLNLATYPLTVTVDGVISNGTQGIQIEDSSGVSMGGTVANRPNVISGSVSHGVEAKNSTNIITIGNYVGTDAGGANRGNGSAGIFYQNVTGASAAIQLNTVKYNSAAGIATIASSAAVQSNTVDSNVSYGIVIMADVTADPDTAALLTAPDVQQNTITGNGNVGLWVVEGKIAGSNDPWCNNNANPGPGSSCDGLGGNGTGLGGSITGNNGGGAASHQFVRSWLGGVEMLYTSSFENVSDSASIVKIKDAADVETTLGSFDATNTNALRGIWSSVNAIYALFYPGAVVNYNNAYTWAAIRDHAYQNDGTRVDFNPYTVTASLGGLNSLSLQTYTYDFDAESGDQPTAHTSIPSSINMCVGSDCERYQVAEVEIPRGGGGVTPVCTAGVPPNIPVAAGLTEGGNILLSWAQGRAGSSGDLNPFSDQEVVDGYLIGHPEVKKSLEAEAAYKAYRDLFETLRVKEPIKFQSILRLFYISMKNLMEKGSGTLLENLKREISNSRIALEDALFDPAKPGLKAFLETAQKNTDQQTFTALRSLLADETAMNALYAHEWSDAVNRARVQTYFRDLLGFAKETATFVSCMKREAGEVSLGGNMISLKKDAKFTTLIKEAFTGKNIEEAVRAAESERQPLAALLNLVQQSAVKRWRAYVGGNPVALANARNVTSLVLDAMDRCGQVSYEGRDWKAWKNWLRDMTIEAHYPEKSVWKVMKAVMFVKYFETDYPLQNAYQEAYQKFLQEGRANLMITEPDLVEALEENRLKKERIRIGEDTDLGLNYQAYYAELEKGQSVKTIENMRSMGALLQSGETETILENPKPGKTYALAIVAENRCPFPLRSPEPPIVYLDTADMPDIGDLIDANIRLTVRVKDVREAALVKKVKEIVESLGGEDMPSPLEPLLSEEDPLLMQLLSGENGFTQDVVRQATEVRNESLQASEEKNITKYSKNSEKNGNPFFAKLNFNAFLRGAISHAIEAEALTSGEYECASTSSEFIERQTKEDLTKQGLLGSDGTPEGENPDTLTSAAEFSAKDFAKKTVAACREKHVTETRLKSALENAGVLKVENLSDICGNAKIKSALKSIPGIETLVPGHSDTLTLEVWPKCEREKQVFKATVTTDFCGEANVRIPGIKVDNYDFTLTRPFAIRNVRNKIRLAKNFSLPFGDTVFGDLDGSGMVDENDVKALPRVYNEIEGAGVLLDYDEDGQFTISDALQLLILHFGKRESLCEENREFAVTLKPDFSLVGSEDGRELNIPLQVAALQGFGPLATYSWKMNGIEVSQKLKVTEAALKQGKNIITLTAKEEGVTKMAAQTVTVVDPLVLAGKNTPQNQTIRVNAGKTVKMTLTGVANLPGTRLKWLNPAGKTLSENAGLKTELGMGKHRFILRGEWAGSGLTQKKSQSFTITVEEQPEIAPLVVGIIADDTVKVAGLNGQATFTLEGNIINYHPGEVDLQWLVDGQNGAKDLKTKVDLATGGHTVGLRASLKNAKENERLSYETTLQMVVIQASAGADIKTELQAGQSMAKVTLEGMISPFDPQASFAWYEMNGLASSPLANGHQKSVTVSLSKGVHLFKLTVTSQGKQITDLVRVEVMEAANR